jgi:hypothetical protein
MALDEPHPACIPNYGICVWPDGYSCLSMNTQLPNPGSFEKDLVMIAGSMEPSGRCGR